jgi:site-specific DNA-methyltransferase (adenine-specific)
MLINGDCFHHIRNIDSDTIDLILIDPPYLISRDSNFRKSSDKTSDSLKKKYDISIDFGDWDKDKLDWDILFSEYYRILKPSGTLIIFYDSWKSNELKFLSEKYKFKQPRIGMWIKKNPVPINSKINYLSNAVEYFYTFVKKSKPIFNSSYDNGIYSYPICHGKERYQHPTQKPLQLISELIKKHSNEGDMVLDTFAGTFTVGHACDELNRRWICIEKDETYFNIGLRRINENREKLGLFKFDELF